MITARDSYRKPISSADGVARAAPRRRRPARPEVVEVFIALLTAGDLSFAHGDDADFEAELSFGRRVHAHARPPPNEVIALQGFSGRRMRPM